MTDANFLTLFFCVSLSLSSFLILFYRGDILQPSILFCGTMTFSALMASIYVDKWSLPFSVDAFFLLTVALFMFSFGDVFCTLKGFSKRSIQALNEQKRYDMNGFVLTIMLFIMAFFAYSTAHELYSLSLHFGNNDGYMGMIKSLRPGIEAQKIQFSRWVNYRQVFALSVAVVALYAFLYNIIYSKLKIRDFKFLLPVIMYIPFMIMTTGRMAMMTFIIFFFILAAILYQKKYVYSYRSKKRTIIFVILICITCIAFFLIMGNLTGKVSSQNHTAPMILAHYAGVSLPAFDVAIHSFSINTGDIGSTTLLGLYRILGRLGVDLPHVDIFLPFVHFNGIDTNVYTAEWRYLKDFGILGMCMIVWLLGSIYSFMYNIIKYNIKSNYLFIILYAMIAFPLLLSSIDERFFLDLIGTPIIYDILLIWVMGKCILRTA